MSEKSALKIAHNQVLDFFDRRRPRAYRRADLDQALTQQREKWKLPKSNNVNQLIDYLCEKGSLRKAVLIPDVPHYRSVTRYLWSQCTPLEIASTIQYSAYLSHGTALFLLGLTEQVPRTLYVNREQTPKPEPRSPLVQANVSRAFKTKQRVSRYIYTYQDHRYVLISGKNTGAHGVIQMSGPHGESLRVTGLERTLVDVVVRPVYAGGIVQVLDAYRDARDTVSVGKLLAVLDRVNHLYPYHQAIGFLMERAGYEAKKLARIRSLGLELDFYLTHGMPDPEYDASWRIFYPQGF